MAPQANEILVQAAQKLSSAITEAGAAPNDFAKNLLELLEVSTKINQFDEMTSTASAETTTEEAQKWREISLMTMKHARTHLVEQQIRLIDQLRGASENGASLFKDALEVKPTEVKPAPTAVKPSSGPAKAVQPPPGLAGPPGLPCPPQPKKEKAESPKSPPGLRPPPGLASAGTAPAVNPPPGFAFQKGQKPKKQAAGYSSPKAPKKSQEANELSFFEARFGTKGTTAAPAAVNFDAYESD